MSGGVDSSVAAALLVEQGHDVVGATLKLWGGPSDSGCCSVADVDDARRVAQQLGIDHHVFNLTEEFDRHVVAPYVEAHAQGRTPNPCIECNRSIKFDRLLERSDRLGFDRLATGHHARVATGTPVAPAAGGRRRQGPVLRALHAGPGRAGPRAVPGGGDDQGRRAGPRRPAGPAHRGQARQPGCLLHRQRRGPAGLSLADKLDFHPGHRHQWARRDGGDGRRRGAGDRRPAPGHGARHRRGPPLRHRGRRARTDGSPSAARPRP